MKIFYRGGRIAPLPRFCWRRTFGPSMSKVNLKVKKSSWELTDFGIREEICRIPHLWAFVLSSKVNSKVLIATFELIRWLR